MFLHFCGFVGFSNTENAGDTENTKKSMFLHFCGFDGFSNTENTENTENIEKLDVFALLWF